MDGTGLSAGHEESGQSDVGGDIRGKGNQMRMTRSTRWMLPAFASALGASAAIASAAEPTAQELMERIDALQTQVEQLESKRNAATTRPGAVQGVEADATAEKSRDADRSGTLFMQAGEMKLTAGHDGKFYIRSEDEAFSFSPTFQLQVRNVTNWIDAVDGDEWENGFELRRAKFGAEGYIFNENLEYKFVWATNRSGGDVFLEDAVGSYQLSDDWKILGGQFKSPVHHEELTSSSKQLAAERSLVNEELGGGVLDRVQGIALNYKTDPINVVVALHDGAGSINTNFRDTPVNDTDYGAAGRIEWLAAGDWKPYGDFSAMGNKDGTLVFGAGADFTAQEDSNLITYTVDGQWENTEGTSVYGAVLGLTESAQGVGDDTTDWGAIVQIGQMLDDHWEPFARVGYLDPDDDTVDETIELTGGVNYYWYKHNAKFTADVTYFPDGAPGDSGLGIIDSGEEDQLVIRLQVQLVI